jgi:hypothetical protein
MRAPLRSAFNSVTGIVIAGTRFVRDREKCRGAVAAVSAKKSFLLDSDFR